MAKQTRVSRLEDHVGYWLRYVSNHVSHAFMQQVEAAGVTVAEWALMRRMYDADAVSPSRLAEQMGMTRGAVSKLIERLCVKGLAERAPSSSDRRRQSASLTKRGKTLVPKLARLADENDRAFFGHWTDDEKADLVQRLTELVHRHRWKDVPVR